MPLSAAPVSRIRKHIRNVRFEGYARADGLWDIEAHLTDLLAQFPSAAIQVPAGKQRDNHDDGSKPFQLDRCHALDTGSEAVRLSTPAT